MFIPTSKKEVERLGWDYLDIIIFSGDALVDHPSFGTAVIARVLLSAGYRVAVIPQPNWRDDKRDFRKLGQPRLFFGVNAGVMDSMINHYTANKRLRSNDAYTPEGRAGYRPDYAVNVYSNILKELYPETPVVIGGVEASLRRLTHYDYWQDKLLPSILISSKADFLIYGMGERPIIALARALKEGMRKEEILAIPQLAYVLTCNNEENASKEKGSIYANTDSHVFLNSFEDCSKGGKRAFMQNFIQIEKEANKLTPKHIVERCGDVEVHINPPFPPANQEEMDSYFDLGYTKKPHARYKGKHIPAYEMIKNSINIHRGCFGGCSFCTIAAHQGRFIESRSFKSILKEVEELTKMEDFKGVISDLGGPSANMYGMRGRNESLCEKCKRSSCLYPKLCTNMDSNHDEILELYKAVESIKGVKKIYIGSGIRYDLFLNEKGFLDKSSKKYLDRLVLRHTSGRLKVAPEHTEEKVLKLMSKPSFSYFERLPMTLSSAMFYSKIDANFKSIFVEKQAALKMKQKKYFFNK